MGVRRSRSDVSSGFNLPRAAWNRGAKVLRTWQRRSARGLKGAHKMARHAAAAVRRVGARRRQTMRQTYSRGVKTTRAWSRWRQRTWSTTVLEVSVRRELRAAARGNAPIVVGPWLSEVGYEALYWVPFVRWFADHYRVDPERFVIVSRGGVRHWYADVATGYLELLDLFTPDELAGAQAQRRMQGDQKQLAVGVLDREVLARVRQRLGADVRVLHPSTMFRLLRQFWLGAESLQHVFDHTRYRRFPAPAEAWCPPLPDAFIAVKFYTGRTLPDGAEVREAIRALLQRVRRGRPIVVLEAGVTLDEHADFGFHDLPDVHTLAGWLTPQTNLAVQTEVIRRAELFVGTCGSLAWLAPLVGTETLAVYADDHLLAPHLYAAREVYAQVGAAPFTPVALASLQALQVTGEPADGRVPVRQHPG